MHTSIKFIALAIYASIAHHGDLSIYWEKHSDGTVTIKWSLPPEIEIDGIELREFEKSHREFLRGSITIDKGATTWRSTPRVSMYGTNSTFFDIRRLDQIGRPEVLTPGTPYRFELRFTGHLRDSLAPVRIPPTSINVDPLQTEAPPGRLDILGNVELLFLVFAIIGGIVAGAPILFAACITIGVTPSLYRVLRGDRSPGEIVLAFAQRNSHFAFFRLYAFALWASFVLKFLPFSLNVAIGDAQGQFLISVARSMSAMKISDWPTDRHDILKLAREYLRGN